MIRRFRPLALAAVVNGCICGEFAPLDASEDSPADGEPECTAPPVPDCGPDSVATYALDGGCGSSGVCTPIGMECPPIVWPLPGCRCCDNAPIYFSQCLYDGRSPVPLTGKSDCFD